MHFDHRFAAPRRKAVNDIQAASVIDFAKMTRLGIQLPDMAVRTRLTYYRTIKDMVRIEVEGGV